MTSPFPGPISAVVAQEKKRRHLGARVNVFIAGKFSFALSADLAFKYGLKPGFVIDAAFLSRLLQEDGDTKALATALHFIGFRPRAREEVRKRLERDEWPPEVIERVLAKLSDQKLLDDAAFSALWVASRTRRKARGSRVLTQELKQKGVEKEQIVAALPDEAQEIENARAALRGHLRQWNGLEERDQKQKALQWLARRGFGFGVALEAWKRREEE